MRESLNKSSVAARSGNQVLTGSNKSRVSVILLIVLLVAGVMIWQHYAGTKEKIRIGVLHSLSGPLATSEKPLVDAIRFAVEEANAAGGINDRKIEAVVVDCRSNSAYCAEQAERLIVEEQVQALFGCWTSECRKAVRPIVEEHRHLLFYALRYEGMEESPNILYGGTVPNQLVMPAVHWALENLGKPGSPNTRGKRIYLAGSDYIYSRIANILIKDLLSGHGAVVAGERYLPLGSVVMDDLVADIVRQQPDIVLNTISGTDNAVFFRTLEKNGITPDKMPVLSFSVTEVGLTTQDTVQMAGHYAARNYFQTIPTPENQAFVQRFRDRFGQQAVLDSPMEASYVNMQMWIQAALEAGSGDLGKVQRTILRQSLPAPEGIVSLDPNTRHVWKVARIGKARKDGQFDIVWDSGRPLEPAPFPTYRSREEWDELLETTAGLKP
ncbi:ABC transporter substrate-binding protein [Nitrosovibrio sp. Nv4]|uniref:ABC transporter substrate-binding protein n=1 Tax=Nitrosovibrio sp. Nv4 TaxID=1945880 RepID=UPI000BDB1408|nr:ABC transporter substrate-binding protein [Nitrosovibrio sp. Nv4]SOD41886.1 urea transport system substrate-binding protein [Nitrosovibrio sp. Nv4]